MLSLTPDEMGPGDGVLTTVPYTRRAARDGQGGARRPRPLRAPGALRRVLRRARNPVRPRRRRTAADQHDRSPATSRPASPSGSPRTTRSTWSSMSTLARSTRRAGHGRLVVRTAQHRWKHERTHGFRDEQGHPRRGRRARRRWASARRHRPARTRARHRRRRHARTPARIRALRGVRASSSRCRRSTSGRCGSTISTAGAAHIPEIRRDDLDAGVVRRHITSHGSVLVRGLLDAEQIARFIAGIDRALAARSEDADSYTRTQTSWYFPLPLPRPEAVSLGRHWVAASGGIPGRRLSEAVATAVLDLRVDRAARRRQRVPRRAPGPLRQQVHAAAGAAHVEHRLAPGRRVPRQGNPGAERLGRAHRLRRRLAGDGSRPAPVRGDGRDRHRRRRSSTGPWARPSSSSSASDAPVVRPEFAAGDALLFDDLFLHRTAIDPSMTTERATPSSPGSSPRPTTPTARSRSSGDGLGDSLGDRARPQDMRLQDMRLRKPLRLNVSV